MSLSSRGTLFTFAALPLLPLVFAGCPPSTPQVPTPAPQVAPPPTPSTTNGTATNATATNGTAPKWVDDAARLSVAIDKAVELAATDRIAAAKAVDEAYRTIYENEQRNLEVECRLKVGRKEVALREDDFSRLQTAMKLNMPATKINEIAESLKKGVHEDARKLDELAAREK